MNLSIGLISLSRNGWLACLKIIHKTMNEDIPFGRR